MTNYDNICLKTNVIKILTNRYTDADYFKFCRQEFLSDIIFHKRHFTVKIWKRSTWRKAEDETKSTIFIRYFVIKKKINLYLVSN